MKKKINKTELLRDGVAGMINRFDEKWTDVNQAMLSDLQDIILKTYEYGIEVGYDKAMTNREWFMKGD